jgi:hypothetical protein
MLDLSRRAAAAVSLALAIGVSAPAWAQAPAKAPPPPAPPAPAQGQAQGKAPPDEVQKLVDDAAKAAKANKWEEARGLLAKAYKLKPGWKTAFELGRAEYAAQKYRDAAEHLAIAYRDKPESLPDAEKKAVEDQLATALGQVGVIKVNVKPAGAEIVVNGVSAGTAPLAVPVFVDPGPALVEARMAGYFGLRTTRNVAAGTEETVELTLHREGHVDVPPPAANSNENIFGGPTLPIVFTGAAVSLAGVLAGGALAIVSDVKASKSHSLEQPDATCGTTCAEQFDALQKQKVTFARASLWSFVGAGAVLVGTGTYLVVTVITKPKQAVKAGVVVRPDQVGGSFSFSW